MVRLSFGELERLSKVETILEVTSLILLVIYPVKLGDGQDANKLSLYHCLVADNDTMTWALITMVADRDLSKFRVLKINRCFVSKTFHEKSPAINIIALDAEILGAMSEVIREPVWTLEALNKVIPEPVNTLRKVVIEPVENTGLPFKTVEKISSECIGTTKVDEFFLLKCTVIGIHFDSIVYPACQDGKCSYRVTEDPVLGKWFCNKCKRLWPTPLYFFKFSIDVSDDTGSIRLKCLHKAGKLLIGMAAIDAYKLQRNDQTGLDWRISAVKNKKFLLKCKAKLKKVGDEKCKLISVVLASSRDK
ncbi:Replication factor A protein 1 [Coemansia sp. BCRC 34962]|nr:Replication factor A protein 1 [Coemansia sp. BCRC 34962]